MTYNTTVLREGSSNLEQSNAYPALPYVGYAVSAAPPPCFQGLEFNSNTVRSQALLCFLNGKHLAQCGMKIKLEVHFCLFSRWLDAPQTVSARAPTLHYIWQCFLSPPQPPLYFPLQITHFNCLFPSPFIFIFDYLSVKLAVPPGDNDAVCRHCGPLASSHTPPSLSPPPPAHDRPPYTHVPLPLIMLQSCEKRAKEYEILSARWFPACRTWNDLIFLTRIHIPCALISPLLNVRLLEQDISVGQWVTVLMFCHQSVCKMHQAKVKAEKTLRLHLFFFCATAGSKVNFFNLPDMIFASAE